MTAHAAQQVDMDSGEAMTVTIANGGEASDVHGIVGGGTDGNTSISIYLLA